MSSLAYGDLSSEKSSRARGGFFIAAYIALYGSVLFLMARFGAFDFGEALGVFVVLGLGFSLIAWLLTLGIKPLYDPVRLPQQEAATLVVYLLPLAVFLAFGFDAIHRWIPSEPADSLAILAAKLAVFVVLPAWILMSRFGYRARDLAPVSFRISEFFVFLGMAVVLIAFQSVAGRGLRDLAAAGLPSSTLLFAVPLVFVWLVFEVGIVEEFFFRVLLQTRLSAALRSNVGGIVLASLLFGLVHAPGLYLRTGVTQEGLGPHPSLFMAIGYSIVITSVAGFFFGVLWARTRNFLLIVTLHAVADLLPNILPTLRAFHWLR